MWYWKKKCERQTYWNYIQNMVEIHLKLRELEGEIITLKEKSAKDDDTLKRLSQKDDSLSANVDNLGFYFVALAAKLNLEQADLPPHNTWAAKQQLPNMWNDFYTNHFRHAHPVILNH